VFLSEIVDIKVNITVKIQIALMEDLICFSPLVLCTF